MMSNLWPRCFFFAENTSKEPAFYSGGFSIDNSSQIKDTFISFNNWGKGVAFVNDFNIGRYWPVKLSRIPLEWIISVIILHDFYSYFYVSIWLLSLSCIDLWFFISWEDHSATSTFLLQSLSMEIIFWYDMAVATICL